MSKKTSNFTESAVGVEEMESEESGSAYEISSDDALGSPDEVNRNASQTRSRTHTPSKTGKTTKSSTTKVKTEAEVIEDAAAWAARFQPPKSAEDVKTPPRKPARVRPRSKRKTLKKAPNKVRAKRLKPYYSDEYRLMLNEEIQDAAVGMLEDDNAALESSQLGSSMWTSDEKGVFFSALGRLGRDNISRIAAKVGTKSEMEVREYVLLLEQGVRDRYSRNAKLLQSIEVPAALEISDECCVVLERAGAAITARQEIASENVDKEKWGDSWLLTKDASRWIEKRVKQKGGEEEIEEVLPAANLLNLSNWLELSREVFMNPGPDHEEENWTNVAEVGETPALRATAFEDFHSLTVNITKRLLSTVLFCTMSRLRARDSHLVKHAEVRPDDVEAAVQILGLKSNSNEFWIKCARRCNLAVFDEEEADLDNGNESNFEGDEEDWRQPYSDDDDDDDDDEEIYMTYSMIEANLRTTMRPSRSRSRSVSRPPKSREHSWPLDVPISSPEDHTSPDSPASIHSSVKGEEEEKEKEGYSDDSESEGSRPMSPSSYHNEAEKIEALEDDQDIYAEIMDMHASSKEEERLWKMLRQTAPFEINTEPVESLERPKPLPTEAEGRQWRDSMQYVASWETLETPVLGAAFEHNRARLSRKGKRKASVAFSDSHIRDSGTDEDRSKVKVATGFDRSNSELEYEEATDVLELDGSDDLYTDGGAGVDKQADTVMAEVDTESQISQTSTRRESMSAESDGSASPRHSQSPPNEWDVELRDEQRGKERSIDSE